jgi:hypothetical protein
MAAAAISLERQKNEKSMFEQSTPAPAPDRFSF